MVTPIQNGQPQGVAETDIVPRACPENGQPQEMVTPIQNGQPQGVAPTGMILNDAGRMIDDIWHQIPNYYPGNDVDEFVVMPNHIHGIIIVGAGLPENGTGLSLPDIVHRFKTMTTKKYTDGVNQSGWRPYDQKLWQRNYYEHIIRDDDEMNRVREYIWNNPLNWVRDDEYSGFKNQATEGNGDSGTKRATTGRRQSQSR
jgi:REP element-mobilizing transposase RayT